MRISGVAWLPLGALLAGCAGGFLARTAAAGGDGAPVDSFALPHLERFNNSGSRLLYLYLRGMALHERGHWMPSNAALDAADELYEDLYTKSASREIGALLTGDYIVEYRGERFEAAYLHYYKVLNYLELGQLDEAAVECRRLNHKLQRFADNPQRSFSDEPFLQYLTGMVYAAVGERSDAGVSLRNAAAGFQGLRQTCSLEIPTSLNGDLAAVEAGDADPATGQLRLFIECGSVPYRQEATLVAPIYREEIVEDTDESRFATDLVTRLNCPVEAHRELEYLLKVAVPTLVEPLCAVASARVLATRAGEPRPHTTLAVKVADLGDYTRRAFDERKAGIWARAVGRALAKYLATRKAENEGGRTAGRVANLVALATEGADTRSWVTLPQRILMASADLPAGVYRVDIVLTGPRGERQGFVRIPEASVRSGAVTFLSYRVH